MTDIGFSRSLLYASKRMTVRWRERSDKEPKEIAATGFVVRRRKPGGVFLCTNRHVVDPDYVDPKYRELSVESVDLETFAPCSQHGEHKQVVRLEDPTSWSFPHNDDDVAVLAPSESDLRPVDECGRSSRAIFAVELLASAEVFNDHRRSVSIEPGDLVAVSGYPEIGGQQQDRPVALFGYISSDPAFAPSPPLRVDRRSIPSDRVVLYQGFSRSGASGSPVLAVRRGMPPDFIDKHNATHRLGVKMGHNDFSPRPLRLVGINGGRIEGSSSEPSALSYFIRSDAIIEAISNCGTPGPG